MSFEARNGTRGARQPGRSMLWINKLTAGGIRKRGHAMGFKALVLTTVGRKSGAERQTPVSCFPEDDGSWLIVASANGAARNPAWYYNLAAHPRRRPGRDWRPHGGRDRTRTPRHRTRRGVAADHDRRTTVRRIPEEDRPPTAGHQTGAPIFLSSSAVAYRRESNGARFH